MPASIDDTFRQALAALQSGNLSSAEQSLRAVLRSEPGHGASLNLLGIVMTRTRRFAEAEACMLKAIEQGAASDATFYNYGVVLQALKRPADALEQFDRALALNPAAPETWNSRGVALNELEHYRDAIEAFDQVISLKDDYAAAYCNKGKSQAHLKEYNEALAAYDRALSFAPALVEAWIGRGNVLCEEKRYGEALTAFRRASDLNPRLAEAWRGQGDALAGLDRPDEAIAAYDKAVIFNPRLVGAWLSRANVCRQCGRFNEALASYDHAAKENSGSALPWYGRGEVHLVRREYLAAATAFERALALQPDLAEAWVGLGHIMIGSSPKDYERAFAAYDRARRIKPELHFVAGHRLHTKMFLCEWANLDADIALLLAAVRDGNKVSVPFPLLGITDRPGDQLRCAQSTVATLPPHPALWRGERYAHERIRVAYVSSDFRDHAGANLMAGMFEHQDRSRFEWTAISFGPEEDSDMRRRIKNSFEHFIDADAQTEREVAELIRQREVDIAVDRNGFAAGGRLDIFARRPAPIQVNYLGYPGTMGAEFIDYILADRTVIPEDECEFYTEKIVWLPNCYQVNDAKRRISEQTPTRQQCGLPESGFVFCCFNNTFKITPEMFKIWMRLLGKVEGSVLWFIGGNATAETNLRREAESCGISPERLIFAPRIPVADHLARHQLADLFLDALPYNAHTTASDALWAGLPVLTCLGSTFAGRVAASLLKAVGLTELITTSLADYEALALKLARDAALLASLKAKLARNRDTYPLFDTKRFTRNIEAAYVTMWERYQRGQPPASFAVDTK